MLPEINRQGLINWDAFASDMSVDETWKFVPFEKNISSAVRNERFEYYEQAIRVGCVRNGGKLSWATVCNL